MTTENEYREALISDYSDAYKAAYNRRPQGSFPETNDELVAEIDALHYIANYNHEIELAETAKAFQKWQERIVVNAAQFDVSIAKYLSWEFEASDTPFNPDSIEQYIYNEFFTFNNVTSEVNKLLVEYAKEYQQEQEA